MKLGQLTVCNFGSYKSLDLDLRNQGLTLVYGNTGSGKSTIPDAPAWVLFGTTAKDGAVDDIRNWQADGSVTAGSLEIQTYSGAITVTRSRGTPKQNDLYWLEEGSDTPIRGKDIADTQKLLDRRLGVSADSFLMATYFHEFSPTGRFFEAKAKERRALFESLANLSLPVLISDRSIAARKETKASLKELEGKLAKCEGTLTQLERQSKSDEDRHARWIVDQATTVAKLKECARAFESEKAAKVSALKAAGRAHRAAVNKKIEICANKISQLEALLNAPDDYADQLQLLEAHLTELQSQLCPTCGNAANSSARDMTKNEMRRLRDLAASKEEAKSDLVYQLEVLEDLTADLDRYWEPLTDADNAVNNYEERAEQEASRPNPYEEQVAATKVEYFKYKFDHAFLKTETQATKALVSKLDRLYDLSFQLRGALLQNEVQKIQDRANRYLETYFDGELRVAFTLYGADDLQVDIQKSGFPCVYKQLSKGQRQLLKLCFSLSVMSAAANKAGIHFENLFFDEALDGLDADLKVKAFDLFSELATEHGSVVVIDHLPNFQSLFSNRLHVTLTGDCSEVESE